MKWNVKDIEFLYPPDVFTGSFDNARMQLKHELQVQKKLELLKFAIESAPDPFEALKKLHQRDHIQFLLNNLESFKESGTFEEAVLALYSRLNGPFTSGGDPDLWNSLFGKCNGEKLYKLGEPVIFTSITVYRGATMGIKRSLSWSPDRLRAQWFAKRWSDPVVGGGDLYEVDLVKSDVLVYMPHNREPEIIICPEFIQSAEIRAFKP